MGASVRSDIHHFGVLWSRCWHCRGFELERVKRPCIRSYCESYSKSTSPPQSTLLGPVSTHGLESRQLRDAWVRIGDDERGAVSTQRPPDLRAVLLRRGGIRN